MESIDKNKICRLCLLGSDNLTYIFDVNIRNGFVAADLIKDFLQLNVSGDDNYPHVICPVCLSKLTDFKQFKVQCHASKITYDNLCTPRKGLLNGAHQSDVLRLVPIKSETEEITVEEERPLEMEAINIKVEPEDIAEEEETSNQMSYFDAGLDVGEIITDDIPSQAHRVAIKQEPEEEEAAEEYYEMRYSPIHMVRTSLGNCSQSQVCDVPRMEGRMEGLGLMRGRGRQPRRIKTGRGRGRGARGANAGRKQVNDSGRFECVECGMAFYQENILSQHRMEHSGQGQLEFGKRLDLMGTLSTHSRVSEVHMAGEEGGSEGSRAIPGRGRRRRRNNPRGKGTDGGRHERVGCCNASDRESGVRMEVPGGNQAEFEDCGKKFDVKGTLFTHWGAHPGGKPFECLLCNKRFRMESAFARHLRMHDVDRPFGCRECDKRFKRWKHLMEHLMVHSGEKPFECLSCGKRFSRKSHCLRHETIHLDHREFDCGICGKRFSRRDNLTAHAKLHSD